MDAWERLISKSSINNGDAWEHLISVINQGSSSYVIHADGLEANLDPNILQITIDQKPLDLLIEKPEIFTEIEIFD